MEGQAEEEATCGKGKKSDSTSGSTPNPWYDFE